MILKKQLAGRCEQLRSDGYAAAVATPVIALGFKAMGQQESQFQYFVVAEKVRSVHRLAPLCGLVRTASFLPEATELSRVHGLAGILLGCHTQRRGCQSFLDSSSAGCKHCEARATCAWSGGHTTNHV